MLATWKTVRVFISSTFRDMQAERDHLVRFVFPRLREQLLPLRIHLVDVDLRWGVTSEQDASEVCREIINECRPRFLCMLGGRYGTIPEGNELSITADEVYFGVLEAQYEKLYALFYFRNGAVTELMDKSSPGSIREPRHSDKAVKLARLKRDIRKAKHQPFLYRPRWNADEERLLDLKVFGHRVERDILATIDDEFGVQPPAQLDEFDEENAAMEAFVEERSERFVLGSRETVLEELLAHASATDGNGYVCLIGAPGSGKSALLAHLSRHPTLNAQASTLLIRHFVGASPSSTDVRRTLRRLCHELKAGCPYITADIPGDAEKLRVAFPDFLRQACARQRVVILLDAVNQFDPASHSVGLVWLPEELPDNARVILSALDGPALEDLRHRPRKPREIELKPLRADDGEAIIEQFRERNRKRFEPDQRAALLAKADAGTPLYLLAALEELRTMGTYEEITQRIGELPPTTRELFAWILERLENDDGFRDAAGRRVGRELVSHFAALLGASRYGLSQRELAELLDGSDPQGNVAALLHLLRPYLMRRRELLDFYHGQFRTAAEEAWLNTDAQRQAAHAQLADYFREQADPYGNGTWNGTPRGFSELPHHVLRSKRGDESFTLARDEAFLIAQRNSFPREPDLPLQTVRFALQAAIENDDAAEMAEFVLGHARRLMGIMNESPLGALRAGDLHHAWELADLHPIKVGSLWHLLLAWELHDQGKPDAARATLERLQAKQLVPLGCDLIVELLLIAAHVNPDATSALQQRLVGGREHREALCSRLCDAGHFLTAASTAEGMEDASDRAFALAVVSTTQADAGDLAGARVTLSAAETSSQEAGKSRSRVSVLTEIAVAQARAGEAERSSATLSVALREVVTMDRQHRQFAFADIASAQARTGDIPGGLETAQGIEGAWASHALWEIAKTQAQTGDLAGALRTVSKDSDTPFVEKEREVIAVAQARAGDFTAARNSILSMNVNEASHGRACSAVFEMQARAQGFAAALASAYGIGDSQQRSTALAAIAKLQAEQGDSAAAIETARTIDNDEDWQRASALRAVTVAQARGGNFTAALDTAAGIEVESLRVRAVAETTIAQAQLGSSKEAETILIDALERARLRAPAHDRYRLLEGVASSQAHIGAGSLARTIFSAAIEEISRDVTARPPYENLPDKALEEIAMAFASVGNDAMAIDSARAIHPYHRASVLARIAKIQVITRGSAYTILAAALEAVRETEMESRKGEALQDIGLVLYRAGDLDAARSAFAAAMAKAPNGNHREWCRAEEMAAVAAAHARARAFFKALSTALRIRYVPSRIKALIEIAGGQEAAGKIEAALKTLAEAAASALEIQDDTRREEHQADVAVALARVGDFGSALRFTKEIKLAWYWGRATAQIVAAQAQAGQIQTARATLAAALEAAPQFDHPTYAMVEMAVAQALLGEVDSAHRTFGVTLDLARKSPPWSFERFALFALVATAQARAGFGEAAVRTANLILSDRNRFLPQIAAQLASDGDHEYFKRLLLPCSRYMDSANLMCGLLARLYPEHATAIVHIVQEGSQSTGDE